LKNSSQILLYKLSINLLLLLLLFPKRKKKRKKTNTEKIFVYR